MVLKEKCKKIGITVQDYQKWLKRAKDSKCEAMFITHEYGDKQPFPYNIAKRENIGIEREMLDADILMEVLI